MGRCWKPDEAFFDLLRDKRAINAMVAEIASPAAAKAALTETATTQKTIIRDCLAGNSGEAKPDWRPRWMQVPARSYIDGAPCAPADARGRIGGLFEPGETETSPKTVQAAKPAKAG